MYYVCNESLLGKLPMRSLAKPAKEWNATHQRIDQVFARVLVSLSKRHDSRSVAQAQPPPTQGALLVSVE